MTTHSDLRTMRDLTQKASAFFAAAAALSALDSAGALDTALFQKTQTLRLELMEKGAELIREQDAMLTAALVEDAAPAVERAARLAHEKGFPIGTRCIRCGRIDQALKASTSIRTTGQPICAREVECAGRAAMNH